MDLSHMEFLGPCLVAGVSATTKDDGVEVILFLNAAVPMNAWASACVELAANGVRLPEFCTTLDAPGQSGDLVCRGMTVMASPESGQELGIVMIGPFRVTHAAKKDGVVMLTFSGRATTKKPVGHQAIVQGMFRGLQLLGQPCALHIDTRLLDLEGPRVIVPVGPMNN